MYRSKLTLALSMREVEGIKCEKGVEMQDTIQDSQIASFDHHIASSQDLQVAHEKE